MTSTSTRSQAHDRAAAALTEQLPVASVSAVPRAAGAPPQGAGRAQLASYVGTTTVDVAVLLHTGIPEESVVSAGDVLRPALEAATGTLGAGLLSEVTGADAGDLLADPSSSVYDLVGEAGTVGWFAIRTRHTTPDSLPDDGRLRRISDVEMTLSVELGRTRMRVRDVLALEPGGVVELDRSAGAPADLLLNGRLIARGEVVVVDQDYAIRITEILDVADGRG